jgi:hypothetical protein
MENKSENAVKLEKSSRIISTAVMISLFAVSA